MSTRGAYGFRLNSQDFVTYNSSDSYPSGLGVDVANDVNALYAKYGKKGIQKVAERISPTSSDDYSEDRGLFNIFEKSEIYQNSGFLLDSLFCEWAYILDLDHHQLEIYRGFNQICLGGKYGVYSDKIDDYNSGKLENNITERTPYYGVVLWDIIPYNKVNTKRILFWENKEWAYLKGRYSLPSSMIFWEGGENEKDYPETFWMDLWRTNYYRAGGWPEEYSWKKGISFLDFEGGPCINIGDSAQKLPFFTDSHLSFLDKNSPFGALWVSEIRLLRGRSLAKISLQKYL